MTFSTHYDVAIIGGGLSGSLLTMALIERRLTEHSVGARAPLRIMNCDRDGAFGAGVPYGDLHAQPGFLLIEPVLSSTPPRFHEWLLEHRSALIAEMSASSDPALQAWLAANAEPLARGELEGLFVPRRLFGKFIRQQHAAALARARACGHIEVDLVTGEAVELRVGAGVHPFEVRLANGSGYRAGVAVLAIGNIPRAPHATLGCDDGYVHDLWSAGYAGVRRTIAGRAAVLGRKLELVLVGSGASAAEVIYFLAHEPDLLAHLQSVRVVSRSGYLCGGGLGAAPGTQQLQPHALARPSAREYVQASQALAGAGVLSAVAFDLQSLQRSPRGLQLRGDGQCLSADVIVNCTGSGEMDATASRLLRNMLTVGPFRMNELKAGFVLRPGSLESADAEGCFIIGPLLNEVPVETHVESIHGVYRAVARLAPAVYERLS